MINGYSKSKIAMICMFLLLLVLPIAYSTTISVSYNGSLLTVTAFNSRSVLTTYNLTVIEGSITQKTTVSNIYGTGKVPLAWVPNSNITVYVNTISTNYTMPSVIVKSFYTTKSYTTAQYAPLLLYVIFLILINSVALAFLIIKTRLSLYIPLVLIIISIVLNLLGFSIFQYYPSTTTTNNYVLLYPNYSTTTLSNQTVTYAVNPYTTLLYVPLPFSIVIAVIIAILIIAKSIESVSTVEIVE